MRLHAIVLVLGLMLIGSPAMAGMKVSVFGDGTFSRVKTTNVTDPSSKLGIGGGTQIEFGFGPVAGLELGAVYLSRKMGPVALFTQDSTYTYIQIPLQLRYWVGRYLTIGVGGYYAIPIGDIKLADGSTQTYAANGLKKSDYGLLGSVGFNIPMSPMAALFVEGRYAMGLVDQNEPAVAGVTTKWNDIQALAGFRFGMGK